MKKAIAFLIAAIVLFALPAAFATEDAAQPTLTYIGHAELMIVTAKGTVIYVDPAPSSLAAYDYEQKADIILVTHEHGDHNKVDIVPKNDGCEILRVKDTINKDGTYNTLTIDGVTVIPVPAENKNHNIKETNGFIIQFDGFTVYHAADTDKLISMADLKQYDVDYAFFPSTGSTTWTPPKRWKAPSWSAPNTTRPSIGLTPIPPRSRPTTCCSWLTAKRSQWKKLENKPVSVPKI